MHMNVKFKSRRFVCTGMCSDILLPEDRFMHCLTFFLEMYLLIVSLDMYTTAQNISILLVATLLSIYCIVRLSPCC